jgi:menaquinone-dependent protoporphyrinogen oxidase
VVRAIAVRPENRVSTLRVVKGDFSGRKEMRVLVTYASKAGSTKGIAEFIGEKLRGRGIQVDVKEVGSASNASDYDAFVIGSAVYMFHWLKEAKQFVSRNKSLLSGRPVWFFSSGPTSDKPTNAKGEDLLKVSGPNDIDELLNSVKPRDHKVFFGGLDGSRLGGFMGLAYRMARRSESARESMPEGDFRDWKEIEAWTNSIADAL